VPLALHLVAVALVTSGDHDRRMATDIWPTIHAERKALADDLSGLTPDQWESPSLCGDWNVTQVLAHQVATAKLTPPKFIGRLAAAGFRFGTFAERAINDERQGGPADVLARYRAVEKATTSPPGPKQSWLGETIIHAEDIRRPLGIAHTYPMDALQTLLEFYSGSNVLIGSKKRIAGVTLKATDSDYSHGSGPVVEGPSLSLLLAATGRKPALDDLSGPGVELLRSR
jgi:uncharacterized protein (TIGR03083 family)